MKKVSVRGWFCPSILGVVAGVIMLAAGIGKLIGGTQAFTFVGGMFLGLFGVAQGEMATVALVLGAIAAVIETLGGLSFALGCCKTSRYAAVGLATVMLVATLVKIKGFEVAEGGVVENILGFINTIRLDVLLLAVFAHKAIRTIKSCCGMQSDDCCGSECPKK